jgi:hypothetical protein
MVCEAVRSLVELTIRPAAIADDERDPIGDGVDRVLDQVRDVPGDALTLTLPARGVRRAGSPVSTAGLHGAEKALLTTDR